jgi:ketosteroid isomerase-like protein
VRALRARVVRLAAAVLCAAAAACGSPPSAEDEIRATFEAAERAAEARDTGAVLDLVAPDFSDAQGRDRDELRQLVRGWFVLHPSVALVTRVESLELESPEHARASLTVGLLGQRGQPEALDYAADLQTIDVVLRRDGGEWRIVRAEWRSALR